ncbi:unnamed protein product [Dicrocoelium dendriticum]|nr:unnamed protein product [Dicrocoelium dendriticum]
MQRNMKHRIDTEPGTPIRYSHEVRGLLTDKPNKYTGRVNLTANGIHSIRTTKPQSYMMIAKSLSPLGRDELCFVPHADLDGCVSETSEPIRWRAISAGTGQDSKGFHSLNPYENDTQSVKSSTSHSELYETEHPVDSKKPSTPPGLESLTTDRCNGKNHSVNTVPTLQSNFMAWKEQRESNAFRNFEEKTNRLKEDNICLPPHLFQPNSRSLLIWLTILSTAVLYNFWIPIARQAFYDLNGRLFFLWVGLDVCADLIYLADIGVQFNTTYLKRGLVVQNRISLAKHYLLSTHFRLDIISIIPLDLIQLKVGIQPMLRFTRLVKMYRARQWKTKVENRSSMPNLWRVINLIHVLFLGCHWFGCTYYIISTHQKFSTTWGYQPDADVNETTPRTYLKTFYWSTLALTTIGVSEDPVTDIEFLFMCCSYLIGLFVFATVVGQVGNIINTRNAARLAMEEIMDNVKHYMHVNAVAPSLQKRILRWYEYAWNKRQVDGVGDLNAFQMLPHNLKTELALNVHLKTLKKVSIFQECRPEFLHDLVLQMKSVIFTPGDYVCRKGEIAREMFIIKDGVLEVVGSNGVVLATMQSGDYFGEIGILNLDGKNKRTADVRAVGYADLFTLSRADVLDALQDHPDAEVYMIRSARKRLQGAQTAATNAIPTSTSQYDLVQLQKRMSGVAEVPCEGAQATSSPEAFADIKLNRLAWAKERQLERLNALMCEFSKDFQTLLINIIDTYEQEIKDMTTLQYQPEIDH